MGKRSFAFVQCVWLAKTRDVHPASTRDATRLKPGPPTGYCARVLRHSRLQAPTTEWRSDQRASRRASSGTPVTPPQSRSPLIHSISSRPSRLPLNFLTARAASERQRDLAAVSEIFQMFPPYTAGHAHAEQVFVPVFGIGESKKFYHCHSTPTFFALFSVNIPTINRTPLI